MTQLRMHGAIIACVVALSSAAVYAQEGGGRRGPPPVPSASQLQSGLGVDAQTASQVNAILVAQREQMEQTRQKLEALLTKEQLRALRGMMRPEGARGGGSR
jgi:hypothetical protein